MKGKWIYDKTDKRLYTEAEWKAVQEKRGNSPKKADLDMVKAWEHREQLKHHKWVYCRVQKKVVPWGQQVDKPQKLTLANIAHGYIPDEMAATKHSCDGKHYTSKAKYRAVTRAHGREEVGTAYENGYDPFVEAEKDRERAYRKNTRELLREHLNSARYDRN